MTLRLFSRGILLAFLLASGLASRKAGEGNSGPWWMRQTALTEDGRFEIPLTQRPW